jgi:SAM-dependent methyltransferase
MSAPRLDEIRSFWNANPIGDSAIGSRDTPYDYFRSFDNLRESVDVEPYAYSNFIHGYESSAGRRVLDYGCGNGYVLSHYAKHGARVVGVDLTPAAIRLSRQRFALMGLDGVFLPVDGQRLPLATDSFDIVCSMGVLICIPDPRPVLAELFRVLKPGGKLILMLYHRNSWRYFVTFRYRQYFGPPQFRGKSLQQILNMNDGAGNPYNAVYSIDEARGLLSAFERHVFHVNKLGARELALWLPVLSSIAARLLPQRLLNVLARRIGWNLYCQAYKPASLATPSRQ